MALTQIIYLTQGNFGVHPTVHAVQNDTGRVLKMVVRDVMLSSGSIGGLYFKRSDGTYYNTTAELDLTDNAFTADMTQALTQAGNTRCNLTVTDSNNKTVSSYPFLIIVHESQDGTSEAQLGYSIEEITEIIDSARGGGLTEDVKQALLNCFYHVAWIDEHGQDYVDNLEAALYPPAVLTSITAIYNQTGTIYDTDDLDDLKPDLTVMATYDNGQSVPVSTYTLSGSLVSGTSTIRVNYDTKYTTFDVTVTHMPGIISVVNNLVNATNSNIATTVSEGDSYTATISPASGYTLTGASVIITMGSTDITSSVYSNGVISIDEVTDTLTISVSAVAVTLVSISAVYTQSETVYDTDSLDSLKSDLVVTATYSDSSTATIPSTDYTLSGTLTVGTSTVTVSYGEKTTTFNVTVSSYVTIGLVAYWDGIDNTGNGHSSSASSWADLAGNYDLTKIGSALTWNNDSVQLTGADDNGFYSDNLWTFSSDATIEVVLEPTNAATTEQIATFDRDSTAISGQTNRYDARRFGVYSDKTAGFVGKSSNTYTLNGVVSSNAEIRKMVAVYSGFSVVKALVNNIVLAQSTTQTHSFNFTGNPQIRIGAENFVSGGGGKYPFKGKIYAIRVYNRALTDEEITQNFNYDNNRFSLGL